MQQQQSEQAGTGKALFSDLWVHHSGAHIATFSASSSAVQAFQQRCQELSMIGRSPTAPTRVATKPQRLIPIASRCGLQIAQQDAVRAVDSHLVSGVGGTIVVSVVTSSAGNAQTRCVLLFA